MSSQQQPEIRYAAETLYRNAQHNPSFHPSRYDITRSHHAHLDLANFFNEDFIAGYMQDGHMSTVRRFFCLFVAFDLFFISLLWFLCIMMNGDTVLNALKVQVLHYTIQSSLFDIIFAAFIRFLLLMLFYGVFAINHWSVIAWMVSAQPIIQVLMIIVSCLVAWGEAWFLDCRVIPQEKNAQRFYRLLVAQDNERATLLQSYLNTLCNIGTNDGSIANFYSPLESANNSESEEDEQDELYKNKGIADIKTACELLECTDWRVEKNISATGDRILSLQRKCGKIYRLTGQINLPAKMLMEKLYYGIEHMPSWNPTVIEAKVLKKIDNHTDITYSVSAPGGAGLVDSREFVNLRCWQLVKNGNIFEDSNLAPQTPLTSTSHQLKKSHSAIQLDDENDPNSPMNQSTLSLSKSPGAKVFSEDEFENAHVMTNSDEFVDANDHQHDMTISVPIERERIQQSANIESCDRMYVVSGASIKYDCLPCKSSYVRGENLMGCWAMRESITDPNVCTFEWLMCLDLKIRVPRFVLDKAFAGVMQDFMLHLRKHCDADVSA